MRDEFFHSASHELLVDQGSNSVLSTSFRTVDDYVWLGGRPVVLLRGKLDPSLDVRRSDFSVDCRRNGEAAACGAWFPVTDHIGKPVLMLDSAGRVAGAADHDPFGHVNRVLVSVRWTAPPSPPLWPCRRVQRVLSGRQGHHAGREPQIVHCTSTGWKRWHHRLEQWRVARRHGRGEALSAWKMGLYCRQCGTRSVEGESTAGECPKASSSPSSGALLRDHAQRLK